MDMISITWAEYERLLEDRHMLLCLEENDVHEWPGYDLAEEQWNLTVEDFIESKIRRPNYEEVA